MPASSRQNPASSSQPKAGVVPAAPVVEASQPAVNRKKAKRRAKEAAKRAAGEPDSLRTGSPSLSPPAQNGDLHVPGAFDPQGYAPEDEEFDDGLDSDHGELDYSQADLPAIPRSKARRKKKGKRGGSDSMDRSVYDTFDMSQPLTNSIPPPPAPPPMALSHTASGHSKAVHKLHKDRIWNTSTQEERENIKEFWLSLEETERRSLVKVEKEAVLKKMKEQQKHSCSCSVCGRKRTAIEEELEVLYDAYYEELEQYANHQVVLEDGTVLTGREAAAAYPPLPSGRLPPFVGQNGPQSRFQEEHLDDEGDLSGEEPYSDEEDDGYDDISEGPPQSALDFFNFGNSLTVQGGILTVADDLLKNDGKKFIEMMEQLAERRMQREEEAQYAAQGLRHPNYAHNHGPPLDDDEEYVDDDDYATDDEPYDDEEEEEPEGLTEEQRMEEGRRMFQIFAARMFEQRVLTAYREKVARERQDKLLEELADEQGQKAQQEAKKAKDAAKKKAKKQAAKQAKEEERLKKEAERQAAEAAAKAEEERKAEEQRLKREEQKRKKEEEKRRQDEEKQRKEEERRKKLADARKHQEEAERKQKELKEKEKLKKEEAKRKERGEREAKERLEREAAEKKAQEVKAKLDKQAVKEQPKKVETAPKAPSQPAAIPSAPALLRKQTSGASGAPLPAQIATGMQSSAQASPHLQIATPVIPKAPSPVRPRQASQQGSVQGSHQSSPKSSQVPSGSSATSPSTTQQVPAPNAQPQKAQPQQPSQINSGHGQTSSSGFPMVPPPGMPYPPSGAAGMPTNGFPPFGAPMGPSAHSRFPPGFDPGLHNNPGFGGPFRGFPAHNSMQNFPPGLNGPRSIGTGAAVPSPSSTTSPLGPANAFGHPPAPVGQRNQGHSRQPSASYESRVESAPAQPIGPPQHSKRPSSGGPPGTADSHKQLGSSALLGDDDEPDDLIQNLHGRGGVQVPFPPGSQSANVFQRPFGQAPPSFSTPPIGHSSNPFGQPPSMSSWSQASPGPGSWGAAAGGFMPMSRQPTNPVLLRQLICSAAKNLSSSPHMRANQRFNGFHSIEDITREVNMIMPLHENKATAKELLNLTDTMGNAQNGGGTLVVHGDDSQGYWVKFEEDDIGSGMPSGARGSIGDIGSPIPGMGPTIHQQHHQPQIGSIGSGFPGPLGPQRGSIGSGVSAMRSAAGRGGFSPGS